MNKKRVIGISLMILVILLIITIISIVAIHQKKGKNINWGNTLYKKEINKDVHKVTNHVDFYAVSNCVNKYLTYLTITLDENSNTAQEGDVKYAPDNFALSVGIKTQEDKKQALYDMLDKQFIRENKITVENLYNFINNREGNLGFDAERINVLEDEGIYTYSVYGKIYNVDTLETIDYVYYLVSIDRYKATFMIEPLKNIYENIDEIVLEKKVDTIEKNSTNAIQYETLTDYDIASKYLLHYQINAINSSEKEYEYIDEDYREKKFGDIEGYKTYVEKNKEKISSSILQSYQVKRTNENTRYICIDQYGYYYIFTETAVMDYTVILDTYTIDLPEFIEKYNTATEQQKVALNIDRFIQALNAKDYKYAYNCLADSYKNNYFKTQADFENYAKQNFYSTSTVGYKEFNTEGELYTYSVVITNKQTGEQMNKTFIMQLGEGTEFVLSFDR